VVESGQKRRIKTPGVKGNVSPLSTCDQILIPGVNRAPDGKQKTISCKILS